MIKHASHRRVNTDNLEGAAPEIANAAGKLWLLSPPNGEPRVTVRQSTSPAVPSILPSKPYEYSRALHELYFACALDSARTVRC